MNKVSFQVDAIDGAWNSDTEYEMGNTGHRPGIKGGYFPVPPVDSAADIRNAMCSTMAQMGLPIEVHHHEVATACQNEHIRIWAKTLRFCWLMMMTRFSNGLRKPWKNAALRSKPPDQWPLGVQSQRRDLQHMRWLICGWKTAMA